MGIPVDHAAQAVLIQPRQIIAKTDIHGEAVSDPPVVLDEKAIALILRLHGCGRERDGRSRNVAE